MPGEEKQLALIAEEASRSVYTSDSSSYVFTPLTKDTTEPGEARKLLPVSLAGLFVVDGSGIYSDFIDNDQDLAAVLCPNDIEDCARAGQYLLEDHMLASVIKPEEVEHFVASQKPLSSYDHNARLKLLAGIQVMFDGEAEGLVPLMVHHRGLGEMTFYKRERLAAAMLDEDMENHSVSSLMERAGVDDNNTFSLFYFPNETVTSNVGQAAARALLREEPIYY